VQIFALIPLGLVAAVTVAGLWVAVRGLITAWRQHRDLPVADTRVAAVHRSSVDIDRQVVEWAKNRPCAMCGTRLRDAASSRHHLALLDPGGGTREWTAVAADALPLALATCLPVCWNCHIAQTFRLQHPELVTERDHTVVHVATHEQPE
jgi:hypothetical protein